MIKLTNGQASAFTSPLVGQLFASEERRFPVVDAFKLSAIIQQIQDRITPYHESMRAVIEKHLGQIDTATGAVTYPSTTNQKKAMEEIEELNKVEVEYIGDKLEITGDWPDLTLAEAAILKPIIEGT